MANIPIQRKRLLGLPVWFLPVLILLVVATGWMVLADDDQPEVDVIEAGPAYTEVPDAPDDVDAPPPPPAYRPAPTSDATQASVTDAAIEAGSAAGAAAGAAATRAVLASVGDVGRTIRQSAATVGVLNGRPVRIAGARVSSIVSDRAFLVGDGADQLMVVIDPPTDASPVRVGDAVTVSGTLETFEPRVGEPSASGGYVVVAHPGGIAR